MIDIGKYNKLKIERKTDFGFFLEDEEGEEVLLPNRYVTPEMKIGDKIDVFIYTDSEDRIIATTEHPYVIADQFGYLEVKEVTNLGAFVDIGLQKDVLIPFKNQGQKLQPGRSYLLYIYLDDVSERLVGTDRIRKRLSLEPTELKNGDKVDLLIGEKTDLGYFTIVDQKYHGLLYEDELFQEIFPGEKTKGFVKNIREDGKIDLALEMPGYGKVEPNAEKILNYLKAHNGFIPITDKSDPMIIKEELQMSKKTFKKAVGALYKDRKVMLKDEGIELVTRASNKL
ncbi:MAG: CvfB family protein [Candidatus Cyclobacteriaceae bacterium M2_1C_046]